MVKSIEAARAVEAAHALDGVILVSCADMKPAPVSWLWRYWLALGKLRLLAGDPGQGKTTLALAMAATVSSGRNWPDGTPCEAGNVVIWSGEDDATDTLVPRLIGMGAAMNKVPFVDGLRAGGKRVPFDPARDMPRLAAAVKEIGGMRLLIVDPVVSAVTGDSRTPPRFAGHYSRWSIWQRQ